MTETTAAMTSYRPYLLRALYEWISDNQMTPQILVDANLPHVQVPTHAVQQGRIVLNIAERAVSQLQMDNDVIRFSARFAGVSHAVLVPIKAVIAIYARETGQGMVMPEEAIDSHPAASDDVLDMDEYDDDAATTDAKAPSRTNAFTVVEGNPDIQHDNTHASDEDKPEDPDDPDHPPSPKHPHLRVVK